MVNYFDQSSPHFKKTSYLKTEKNWQIRKKFPKKDRNWEILRKLIKTEAKYDNFIV